MTAGVAACRGLAVPPLTREGPGRLPISLADKASDGEQTVRGSSSRCGPDSAVVCAPAGPRAGPWSSALVYHLPCSGQIRTRFLSLSLFIFSNLQTQHGAQTRDSPTQESPTLPTKPAGRPHIGAREQQADRHL